LFYAFPETEIEGEMVAFTPETFRTVRNEWRTRQAELEIEYTKFYRANYVELVRRVRERL